MGKKGLYDKYEISKDGNPVDGEYFVLKPENDPAARRALQTYSATTDNEQLAADIMDWLSDLDVQLANTGLELMKKEDGYWLSVDADNLHGLYRISDGQGGYKTDEVLERASIDYT